MSILSSSGIVDGYEIDLRTFLQLAYTLSSALILLIYVVPPLRARFLSYGARSNTEKQTTSTTSTHTSREHVKNVSEDKRGVHARFLDIAASFKVPHDYFMHFYIISILCSFMWIYQIHVRGPLYSFTNTHTDSTTSSSSMRPDQIVIIQILMLCQGIRRLYECLTLTIAKTSTSKMWIGHYVLGIAFYVSTSVAVFIEGLPALRNNDPFVLNVNLTMFFCLIVFIFASGIQHDCHAYLASLEKYTLPVHPAFHNLVCPHYTAECAIYLSMALLGAPQGALLNKTLFSAFIFVLTNLSVSADLTKRWYEDKFGKKSMSDRWEMVPGIW